MGKKTDIDAIEVVRRIRDQHAEMLEGKSTEEILEFFRKAGERFRKRPRGRRRVTSRKRSQQSARKARRG
jgi:hypothetical protein